MMEISLDPFRHDSADAYGILASALRLRSLNRWIYAGAYAPPFGTLLPTVATSYIPRTLSEIKMGRGSAFGTDCFGFASKILRVLRG